MLMYVCMNYLHMVRRIHASNAVGLLKGKKQTKKVTRFLLDNMHRLQHLHQFKAWAYIPP